MRAAPHHTPPSQRFDAKFFFVWLIPPIIFEAGFNMDAKAFFANIAPTIFFAFVGTFLSTFVVGGWVYYFGQLGWGYPMALLPCLVFGSLISATDPVTVLAVFQALGVKVDLFSMVFGESVLNDAVAIVLSETLLTFATPMPGVSFSSRVVEAVVSFCSIFGWSLVIGAAYGAASALVLKVADLRHHAESKFIGVGLVAAFAWASYFTAEALQKSGIVTIMFCGIVMAFYARDNLHPEAQALAKDAFKCTALIAETFVFVYLGMAVFTFPILAPTTVWGFTFIMAVPACFVGRLHIYLGSWLTNCARDATTALPPISSTYQFIMWFSGLRGGVAFALAAGIYAEAKFPETCGGAPERGPEHNCVPAMSDGLAMLQATLLIAAMTIFVFGGAITSVCRWGQVLEDKNAPKVEAPEEGHGPPVGLLARIDTYFLHPLLTAGDVPGDGHHGPPPNGTEMGNYAQLKEEKAAPAAAPAPAKRLVGAVAPRAGSSRGAAPVAPAAAPAAPGDLKGEDAVDALRTNLPSYSGDQLRALLNASGGSYTAAVQRARSGVATELL